MEMRLDGNDWDLLHLLPSEWLWRKVWQDGWNPRAGLRTVDYIQGNVPGDVISDARDAGMVPDPYVDMNTLGAEWLSERDWVYRKEFKLQNDFRDKVLRLRFDGVDHHCIVYLNGQLLGEHQGMCLPFEFDVSEIMRLEETNRLTVIVMHKPDVNDVQGQIGWTSRARIWKARFAYDWDWCVRLVPIGIWQSVRILATGTTWIEDLWARPLIDKEQTRIDIHLSLKAKTRQPRTKPLELS